jgi:hypothetical protein
MAQSFKRSQVFLAADFESAEFQVSSRLPGPVFFRESVFNTIFDYDYSTLSIKT